MPRALLASTANRITAAVAGKAASRQKGKDTPMPGRPRNEPVNVDKDWFSARFRALGLSQRQVAAALGREAAILTRLLQGARQVLLPEAVQLANLLHVDLCEIARRCGYPTHAAGIPIVGAIRDGAQVTSITSKAGRQAVPEVRGKDLKALVVEARGGDLAPYDGATLYYEEHREGFRPDAIGRLCVVEAQGEIVPVVGTLTKAATRGAVTLTPLGGKPRQLTDVMRAYPIVAILFA